MFDNVSYGLASGLWSKYFKDTFIEEKSASEEVI